MIFFETRAPWKLAKSEDPARPRAAPRPRSPPWRRGAASRSCCSLLVMPAVSEKGARPDRSRGLRDARGPARTWGARLEGLALGEKTILFPAPRSQKTWGDRLQGGPGRPFRNRPPSYLVENSPKPHRPGFGLHQGLGPHRSSALPQARGKVFSRPPRRGAGARGWRARTSRRISGLERMGPFPAAAGSPGGWYRQHEEIRNPPKSLRIAPRDPRRSASGRLRPLRRACIAPPVSMIRRSSLVVALAVPSIQYGGGGRSRAHRDSAQPCPRPRSSRMRATRGRRP